MTKFIQLSILMGLTATLMTGCGFEPLYGSKAENQAGAQNPSSVVGKMSQVDIALIPDKSGQLLRNHLIDRLYQSGYPSNSTATLHIDKITEARTDLDLTKSSDATLAQLRMTTNMVLTDDKGNKVLERTLQTIASFNVLGSEFATRVTEEAARESAINDLARQIELNLSLYYSAQ